MLDRRKFVLSALTLPALIGSAKQVISAPSGGLVLAMHQYTSSAAGFRGSLEGWSRASIEFVELNAALLDVFHWIVVRRVARFRFPSCLRRVGRRRFGGCGCVCAF